MADLDERRSTWNELTVVNLKKVLKDNNLPLDGLKSVLVERLVESRIPFPHGDASLNARSSKKSRGSAPLEKPAQSGTEQPPAEVLKPQKISKKTKGDQDQLEQEKLQSTRRGSSKKPRLEADSRSQKNESAKKLQGVNLPESSHDKESGHKEQESGRKEQESGRKEQESGRKEQESGHKERENDHNKHERSHNKHERGQKEDVEHSNDLVWEDIRNPADNQSKSRKISYSEIMNYPTIQIDNQLTPEKLSEVVEQDREGVSSTIVVRNFTRPITLDTVKDALKVHGDILKFWMNKLRTHCFVTFVNEEQAIRAKEGLQGIKFPPGIGKILSCEFITREEADAEIEKTERSQSMERVPIFPPSYPSKSYLSKTRSPQRNSSNVHEDKISSPARPYAVRELKSRYKPNPSLFKRTNARPHIYYTPNAAKYRKYRYSSESRRKVSRSRSSGSSSCSKHSCFRSISDSRSSYSSKSPRKSVSTPSSQQK